MRIAEDTRARVPPQLLGHPALGLEFSQTEYIPFWQAEQTPQAIGKGTTTRSPTLRLLTWGPTSTTSPMNSWPRMSPGIMAGT